MSRRWLVKSSIFLPPNHASLSVNHFDYCFSRLGTSHIFLILEDNVQHVSNCSWKALIATNIPWVLENAVPIALQQQLLETNNTGITPTIIVFRRPDILHWPNCQHLPHMIWATEQRQLLYTRVMKAQRRSRFKIEQNNTAYNTAEE